MNDSGITDTNTGNVPGIPTDITTTEEIAPTDTSTGDINTRNICTYGNTSITRTPGVSRGGNLSPRAFDTLIRDITPQPGGEERGSDIHSRGGTSVAFDLLCFRKRPHN